MLLLLDGLDEAGRAREVLTQHILYTLPRQGFVMLLTSRPNGVPVEEFERAGFLRVSLRTLTEEQQHEVIKQRLAKHFGYDSEATTAMTDTLTRYVAGLPAGVTGNPLILSMVISIMISRQAQRTTDGVLADMPKNVTETYEVAINALLKRLELKERGDTGGNSATADQLRSAQQHNALPTLLSPVAH